MTDDALQEKLKEEHPNHEGRFQWLQKAICPSCEEGSTSKDNVKPVSQKSGENVKSVQQNLEPAAWEWTTEDGSYSRVERRSDWSYIWTHNSRFQMFPEPLYRATDIIELIDAIWMEKEEQWRDDPELSDEFVRTLVIGSDLITGELKQRLEEFDKKNR